MSDYTPSIDTARECFVDGAAGEFIAEDFDRVLESVRAEERERIARLLDAEHRKWGRTAAVGHASAFQHAARIARENA